MPFAETREFANVGVVLIAPKQGVFKFQLANNRFGRVTQFFDDLDGTLYKNAIDGFKTELERLEGYYIQNRLLGAALVEHFKEVTRPRESVVHFGQLGSLITDDVNLCVEQLFARFVGRNFAEPVVYREERMVRTLKKQLNQSLSQIRYTAKTLHAGIYEIKLPLVTCVGDKYRVIKPLALDQSTALKAVEHGEQWVQRVGRLVRKGILDPERTLFALDKPTVRTDLLQVYDDISVEIKGLNAQVVDFANKPDILQFAAADLSPESVESSFH